MIQETLKIKPMTCEELTLAVNRLTRFKFPEIKYNRVFREILAKHLISPKISFKEYDTLDEESICELVEKIFTESICVIDKGLLMCPCELYKKVIELGNKIFLVNEQTRKLMNAKIPYEAVLKLNEQKELSPNLEFLRRFSASNLSVCEVRSKFGTKFPIEKIVLAEGITEEILLPKFAKILGYDFDKNGVMVVPAGGKNQVAKDYIEYMHKVNIPIVILLDADAKEVSETISDKLRTVDKLILIEKGEFEDILPLSLIEKAINYQFLNFFKATQSDFSVEISRVKDLEEIYRINGLGEFKKAEFAHNVDYVLGLDSKEFVSDEIKRIIDEIQST